MANDHATGPPPEPAGPGTGIPEGATGDPAASRRARETDLVRELAEITAHQAKPEEDPPAPGPALPG